MSQTGAHGTKFPIIRSNRRIWRGVLNNEPKQEYMEEFPKIKSNKSTWRGVHKMRSNRNTWRSFP